jgi:hypothetical protein
MTTAFGRFVAAAQAFTLTSVLSACMLTGGDTLVVPGGAEDFPNTVTPLGRVAVSDFATVGDWEQVPVITPPMPQLPSLDSLQITPPGAKLAVLGKSGRVSSGDIDTLDMSLWTVDTNQRRVLEAYLFGRIWAYAYDSTATSIRRDTVMTQYLGDMSQINLGDDAAISKLLDSILANPGKYLMPLDYRGVIRFTDPVTGLPTGARQAYRLRNTNATGTMDQAEYQTITLVDGGTHRKWVKIYGPEGAYADPQAVPEEFELLLRGPTGDTLSWTSVKDADWDRKLWTSEASGVVDLFFRVRNPQSQPTLSRMHSSLRATYRQLPGGIDSLAQLSYQEQRWLNNGRNVTFTFKGANTSGLLVGNDTALMTVDTVFALRDSMITFSAVYKMLLGPIPDRMATHRLAGYSVAKYWRAGDLFSNVSHFLPSTPVLVGQPGFAGLMSTTTSFRNGDSSTTQGSIDSTGFNLQVRTIKGTVASTYNVVLDAAGDLVSYTPLAAPDATAAARRAPLAKP